MAFCIERVKMLRIILLTVEKKCTEFDNIEYIVNVWETDVATAFEITRLDKNMIDTMIEYLNNNQMISKDKAIEYIREHLTDNICNFILHNQDTSPPTDDYVIKIRTPDVEFGIVDRFDHYFNSISIPSYNIYSISGKNIEIETIPKIISASTNDSVQHNCVIELLDANKCTLVTYSITWNKIDSNRDIRIRYPSNIFPKLARVWFLDRFFDVNERYLKFYSLICEVQGEYGDELSEFKTIDKILHVPLIDTVRVDSVLGFVSVKQVTNISRSQSDNWTVGDYGKTLEKAYR